MDKDIGLKWILLLAVLTGQFYFISPAHSGWTVVDPPTVSSNWELLGLRFFWAVGQDLENRRGVLLHFADGSWTTVDTSVSSDWGFSAIDFGSAHEGWAVGRDNANQQGALLHYSNGSWTTVEPPGVSSDWGLSAIDFISSNGGWMAGQDLENKKGVLLFFSVVPVTPPTLTTTPVSAITTTSAVSGGTITSDGGASVTVSGVCWDTSPSPAVGGNCTTDGTTTGTFTSSISGLTPNTTYHVRAYATNPAGTGYGNDVTFATLSALSLPTLTTLAVSSVTSTTATSGGFITSDGGTPVTARGVCWDVNINPDVSLPTCTSSGTGIGTFTSFITGLRPITTYHVRAYATNSSGTGYGNDVAFSTTAAGSPLSAPATPTVSSAVETSATESRPVLVLANLPDVSSDWELSGVRLAWAVGQDFENGKGVLLHLLNSTWTSVEPPDVSADWGLSGVDMISSREGWAVGRDNENKRGVLLHFINGSWTSVGPPDVSGDWGLSIVEMISSGEGWAAGQDFENGKGVVLHFIGGSWTPVGVPDVGTDWGLSAVDVISSSQGWAVGKMSDGQNVTGVILQFASPQVSVTPGSIDYGSVEIGTVSDKTVVVRNTGNGSLNIGAITSPSSPFEIPIDPRTGKSLDTCSGKTLLSRQTCRVTYRFLPDSERPFMDSSTIPSNESTVTVTLVGTGTAGAEPVGNPVISETSKSALPPPTLSWENLGNTKFKAWFGNVADFQNKGVRKIALSFKIQDPNANQGVFTVGLTSGQWSSIRRLGGDVTGAVLYWYVESSDIAGRKEKTDILSFALTD